MLQFTKGSEILEIIINARCSQRKGSAWRSGNRLQPSVAWASLLLLLPSSLPEVAQESSTQKTGRQGGRAQEVAGQQGFQKS